MASTNGSHPINPGNASPGNGLPAGNGTPTGNASAPDIGLSSGGSRPGSGAGSGVGVPVVTALARELERTTRRLAGVEALAQQLDTLLGALAADVAALAASDEPDGGPAEDLEAPAVVGSWLAVSDVEAARALLADLAAWVGAVYARYPGGGLASCWLWHPAVVEELWWLRHAHAAALQAASRGGPGSWREVADWHDRLRPGVTCRVSTVLADCELARHTPDGDRHQPMVAVPLTSAVDAVATRWAGERACPAPSPAQLVEAEAHDRAQLRSHR